VWCSESIIALVICLALDKVSLTSEWKFVRSEYTRDDALARPVSLCQVVLASIIEKYAVEI
jgi:hypothetical protein